MADDIIEGPYEVTQTAKGDWWITAPNCSDSDYAEDNEPIFESSGTGKKFGATARHLVRCANDAERSKPGLHLRDHVDEAHDANIPWNGKYGTTESPIRLICPVCDDPSNSVKVADVWFTLPMSSVSYNLSTGETRTDQEKGGGNPVRVVVIGLLCACGHEFDLHVDEWTNGTAHLDAAVHNEAFTAYAAAIGKPEDESFELDDYDDPPTVAQMTHGERLHNDPTIAFGDANRDDVTDHDE